MMDGQLNKAQLKTLQDAVKKLDLPAKKRQRLMWRMAKYGVIAAAKRNVKNQQTPDGQAWPERRSNYRKKMLRQLPKLLHIREMPEIEAVRIYLQGGQYRNGNKPVPAGVVGYGQQQGMSATINRRQVAKPQDNSRKATLKQAKKLRDLGYQIKHGKRWRKPPIKSIAGEMSFAQAGLLIRKLSGKAAKSSWTIDVPSREFLGINQADFVKAMARQLQGIGFGWDVKAQDIK